MDKYPENSLNIRVLKQLVITHISLLKAKLLLKGVYLIFFYFKEILV